MSRKPTLDKVIFDDLVSRLEKKHEYDMKGLRIVPQVWTKEQLGGMGVD